VVQLPTHFLSAIFQEFSPIPQKSVYAAGKLVYAHCALLSAVNHAPQYLDNCAINVTIALLADLLVLRSGQLNRIARQFQILGKERRYSTGELTRRKGKFRHVNFALTDLPRILQPIHQKARLKIICNFTLSVLIQCGGLQLGRWHRDVNGCAAKSIDRSVAPAEDRFRTLCFPASAGQPARTPLR